MHLPRRYRILLSGVLIRQCLIVAGVVGLMSLSPPSRAQVFRDSSATLEARNVYFNRDFRDGPSTQQSRRDEWAQGFILKVRSGYTEGMVGFGLDMTGMLGVRLDSSPDRSGSGLLPVHADGRAASNYSKLGLTAKMKVSATELKLGTLIPLLPTIRPNDGMILPQSFEGTLLTSEELKGLKLTAGRLDSVMYRNSTDREDIALNNKNDRFQAAKGEHFDLLGGDYAAPANGTFSYHVAQLEDVYRQHFVGWVFVRSLGPGTLNADLRWASSRDQGAAHGGKIDNRAFDGMLGFAVGGHTLSAGYQRMSGASAFPYLDGNDAYLVNFAQIGDFAEQGERSWQVRHDYDFAQAGIPGLTLMSRYIRGDNAQVNNIAGTGKEWERNTEIRYVIQRGPFKDVALRVRNATYRSSFSRDADETRVLVTYTLKIW